MLGWLLIIPAVLLALGVLCSRQSADDGGEGVPYDWGDSECGGYRPNMTREQRIAAAEKWRASHP